MKRVLDETKEISVDSLQLLSVLQILPQLDKNECMKLCIAASDRISSLEQQHHDQLCSIATAFVQRITEGTPFEGMMTSVYVCRGTYQGINILCSDDMGLYFERDNRVIVARGGRFTDHGSIWYDKESNFERSNLPFVDPTASDSHELEFFARHVSMAKYLQEEGLLELLPLPSEATEQTYDGVAVSAYAARAQ